MGKRGRGLKFLGRKSNFKKMRVVKNMKLEGTLYTPALRSARSKLKGKFPGQKVQESCPELEFIRYVNRNKTVKVVVHEINDFSRLVAPLLK